MTKIIKRSIKTPKSVDVSRKIVRDANTGTFVTYHTVDAESKTFTSDLSAAFKKNVDAALRKKK